MLGALDGSQGLKLAKEHHPDAIILDIMLPGLDGYELAKAIKRDRTIQKTPILFLSAKGEVESRIKGFELGGDDFVPKPFSPRELMLRLQAVMRRHEHATRKTALPAGPVEIDPLQLKVSVDGTQVHLSQIEFKLLAMLAGNTDTVFSRADLLRDVWGGESDFDNRTVDTYVYRLREKLGRHSGLLETVRGIGYRFVRDEDSH
jgi:two-component system phosphate regulon response regulator PhoB